MAKIGNIIIWSIDVDWSPQTDAPMLLFLIIAKIDVSGSTGSHLGQFPGTCGMGLSRPLFPGCQRTHSYSVNAERPWYIAIVCSVREGRMPPCAGAICLIYGHSHYRRTSSVVWWSLPHTMRPRLNLSCCRLCLPSWYLPTVRSWHGILIRSSMCPWLCDGDSASAASVSWDPEPASGSSVSPTGDSGFVGWDGSWNSDASSAGRYDACAGVGFRQFLILARTPVMEGAACMRCLPLQELVQGGAFCYFRCLIRYWGLPVNNGRVTGLSLSYDVLRTDGYD